MARSQKDAGSTALIGTLTAVYFGICEKKHSNVSSTNPDDFKVDGDQHFKIPLKIFAVHSEHGPSMYVLQL